MYGALNEGLFCSRADQYWSTHGHTGRHTGKSPWLPSLARCHACPQHASGGDAGYTGRAEGYDYGRSRHLHPAGPARWLSTPFGARAAHWHPSSWSGDGRGRGAPSNDRQPLRAGHAGAAAASLPSTCRCRQPRRGAGDTRDRTPPRARGVRTLACGSRGLSGRFGEEQARVGADRQAPAPHGGRGRDRISAHPLCGGNDGSRKGRG